MLLHRVHIILFFLFIATLTNAQKISQHTVMRGETFASIANKYGITEQQLKNANSKYSTCYVGLKLTIPAVKDADKKAVDKTSSAVKKETKQQITNKAASAEKQNNNLSRQTKTIKDKDNKQKTANQLAKKEKRKKFWEKFDAVLTTTGAALTAVSDGLDQMGAKSKSTSAANEISATNRISNQKSNGDMLLITDLIRQNEVKIADYERNIEAKKKEIDKKAREIQRTKPSTVRVGGTRISTGNKNQQYQKTTKKTMGGSTTITVESGHYSRNVDIANWRSVIKYFQQENQWLNSYRMHNGEYISKETYSNHLKTKSEREKANREQRKNARKERSATKIKVSVYDEYENMLRRACNSPEFYYDGLDIKKVQNTMRELRQKYNYSKSPWEDWDGVPGSMK